MDIPDDAELRSLAIALGDALHAQHQMLVTSESCTGGWVAKVLTDIPGSSAWFDRGYVTYTNQAKQDLLAVAPEILKTQGAVSQQTAEAMAHGALRHSPANFSLAITGIAGPGGATPDKPVGLVWFAWARKQENDKPIVWSSQYVFAGDREAVRRQAVAVALKGMLDGVGKD